MAIVAQAFLEYLIGELVTFVKGEISMQLGVMDEVKKLQRRLERLRGPLEYAEQMRYAQSHMAIMKELKDVMYDADDILDTCMIQGTSLRAKQSRPHLVVRSPFTTIPSTFRRLKYNRQIAMNIRKLDEFIDEISKDSQIMNALPFIAHTVKGSNEHHQVLVSARQTSPIQDAKSIVGPQIEEAARKLVASIIKNDETTQCQIFAITGMGGIGKTTLARRIFNDENITSNFPKQRIWLHVSKDYSDTDLLKEMVRNLGESDERLKSRAELEPKLASILPESLFLALDDIWSADVWLTLLQGLMHHRVTKCRVLVTVRDENLARRLGANIHRVEKLDKGSCWELLCKEVFEDGEDAIRKLEEIGSKIVEKCHGLPLAIKTVAGVLKGKEKNEAEWRKVVESEIWSMSQIKGRMPSALYLSYEDLPPILKQCFLYCSLLGANGSMDRDDLVRYWIDEGFVVTKEGSSMEDVAEDCYRELMFRNLLQQDPSVLDATVCTMHDLLRSLGQSLTEGEAICIREDQKVGASPLIKLRRLIIMSNAGEKVMLPDGVTEPKHLRAFFICRGVQNKSIEDGLFKRLCNLRILMLSNSNIERLPYSIGRLFHLRHLDLDGTGIKKLPNSIGRLANLQTLRASRCIHLNQLPDTVMKLHKLRLLHVEDTPLSYVPKGIGQLKNLNAIRGLVIGCDGDSSKKEEKGCDLEELQPLFNLRVLGLHMLRRSSDRRSALSLADKQFLRELLLSEAHVAGVEEEEVTLSDEQIQRTEKIYNDLTPPSSLQTLAIVNFPGRVFPKWMMSTSLADSFPNLTTLHLANATACKELPTQLSQLPRLSYLLIKRLDAITSVGPQFFAACGPGAVAFPSLEFMRFEMMRNWYVWCSPNDDEVGKIRLLPKLRQLVLDDCPRLRSLPKCLSLVRNLKTLWIMQARDLMKINDLPCLVDELVVVECEKLMSLSDLPSLKHLTADGCPRLRSVENLDALQDLCIETSAQHLPTWLSSLAPQHALKKLELRCSRQLLEDCTRNCRNWDILQQIPEVYIRTTGRKKLYIRYTKSPYSYQTNAKKVE